MLPRHDRKISPSLLAVYHHADPSRNIAEAFSKYARERINAGEEVRLSFNRLHRIGLMNGLGFGIPEMDDGRNLVQVVAEMRRAGVDRVWEGLCTIRVAKCQRHDDHLIPDIIDVVQEVNNVPLAEVPAKLEEMLWGRMNEVSE